jgi:hypothetical protein
MNTESAKDQSLNPAQFSRPATARCTGWLMAPLYQWLPKARLSFNPLTLTVNVCTYTPSTATASTQCFM